MSHLLQMRGLKPLALTGMLNKMESHLLQMRGLKHLIKLCTKWLENVASFTDAWIETEWVQRIISWIIVASFTDAWIETDRLGNRLWWVQSHLLQMRGLKHTLKRLTITLKSRIFYRCVDWNYEQAKNLFLRKEVASFTDAWIETSFRARM